MVTGATGIIGPTICQFLQRDGWRVAACGQTENAFVHHENLHGHPVEASGHFVGLLEGRESCCRLVENVEQKLGPIALLVNNAAANPAPTSLSELTEKYCRMMLETNLLAPLWLSQAAERSLVAQHGSIVNISSVRVRRPASRSIMYPVTKAALENLTVALAMELGPKGVRVNTIRVGAIPGPSFMSEILHKLPTKLARRLMSDILPRHVANIGKSLSKTGRAGVPADVAEAVAFLASPKAEFFNAAVLPLEGGFTFRTDDPVQHPGDWNSKNAVDEWLSREGVTL